MDHDEVWKGFEFMGSELSDTVLELNFVYTRKSAAALLNMSTPKALPQQYIYYSLVVAVPFPSCLRHATYFIYLLMPIAPDGA